jgi:hypothetical protein
MNKSHISDLVRADLSKLNADQKREVLRVASKDLQNISERGENRPVQAVDMSKKVASSSRVSSRGLNREPPPIVARKTGKA